MPDYVNLARGDTAPSVIQRTTTRARYVLDTCAGRYLVMCFYGSAADAAGREAIAAAMARSDLFDDAHAMFFGVSFDPADVSAGRIEERLPGVRHFLDYDLAIARAYGAAPIDKGAEGERVFARRFWLVLDPTMRVLAHIPFAADSARTQEVMALVAGLPAPAVFAGRALQAPIVFLPNVFEPDLCARLIDLYRAGTPEPSGFMREIEGKTRLVLDPDFKVRKDCAVQDPDLIRHIQGLVRRRIVPQVRKAHQFEATRMERYIVVRYGADDGGHFRPHRDNTTKGTAHRRFAVTVNLNEGYDGGDLSFPEYGPETFRAPPGGAIVFSCSLLHTVSRVTAGERFAFLPFLYDDAAAKIREQNNAFLDEGLGPYRNASGARSGVTAPPGPA